MHDFLHNILPTDDLVDIARPVWAFDAANRIREGDPEQNRTPKWTYRQGLSTLGNLIVQAGDLEVRTNVRVSHLKWVEHQYQLIDENGANLGTYEQVLVAIPAGQAAELIEKSDLPIIERISLTDALRRAQYRRCITVALGYGQMIQKRPYYALVDTSRKNPLSWLAFEHDKPGHVPAGHSVIVAQMAGGYSLERWDADQPVVISEIADQVSTLLGEDLRRPDWTEFHKWRYSLPDKTLSEIEPNICMRGLWFAGDWSPGGRVHLAAQVGHEVAMRMVLQVDV
jgi:renalase